MEVRVWVKTEEYQCDGHCCDDGYYMTIVLDRQDVLELLSGIIYDEFFARKNFSAPDETKTIDAISALIEDIDLDLFFEKYKEAITDCVQNDLSRYL